MMAMFPYLVDKKIKVAITETEKRLPEKSSSELLSSATRKEAKNGHTRDSFIGSSPLIYLRFALYVQKATVLRWCREVSEHFPFTLDLRRSWRRRGKNVQEVGVPRKGRTRFAPRNLFQFCFSNSRYTQSISSAETARDYGIRS